MTLTDLLLAVVLVALLAQTAKIARLSQRVEDMEDLLTERTCRVCGCTDEEGCMFGCSWIEEDLCSSCNAEGNR